MHGPPGLKSPRNSSPDHFTTNVPMALSPQLGMEPRDPHLFTNLYLD